MSEVEPNGKSELFANSSFAPGTAMEHLHTEWTKCGGTHWECVERDGHIQGGGCGEPWCDVCR